MSSRPEIKGSDISKPSIRPTEESGPASKDLDTSISAADANCRDPQIPTEPDPITSITATASAEQSQDIGNIDANPAPIVIDTVRLDFHRKLGNTSLLNKSRTLITPMKTQPLGATCENISTAILIHSILTKRSIYKTKLIQNYGFEARVSYPLLIQVPRITSTRMAGGIMAIKKGVGLQCPRFGYID